MKISDIKENKSLVLSSILTAIVLTFSFISPALASVQLGIDTHANCIGLQYTNNQEPTIFVDSESGDVNVGYADNKGISKETHLNFKSRDGFMGCSSQATRILSDAKMYQDKYNADMCDEMTRVVNGQQAMPEMDGKQPTMAAAKIFQKQICTAATTK
jgi:hypothetical protein